PNILPHIWPSLSFQETRKRLLTLPKVLEGSPAIRTHPPPLVDFLVLDGGQVLVFCTTLGTTRLGSDIRQVIPAKLREIWRSSPHRASDELRNPLRYVAAVSVGTIVWAAYALISRHETRWNQLIAVVLSIAFLISYVRHARCTWLIALVISAVLMPINIATFRFESVILHSYGGTCFMIGFWLVWIVYIIWTRSRYFAFIREESSLCRLQQ